MPNWCDNTVEIYHDDPAMIERVRESFNKGEFLQEFIPVPEDLKNTVSGFMGEDKRAEHEAQQASNLAKYGYNDWYSFCVNEWGTKWDVGGDSPAQDIPGGLMLTFESAWAPPCNAYEKLMDMGFRLRAMYYEPGMAFAGIFDENGDDCYEYNGMDSKQIAEELPVELDEAFGISESAAEWEAENEEQNENE